MSNFKLKSARFAYEYLNLSIEEIEEQYGFPPALIRSEIQRSNWLPKVTLPALPDAKDLASFASALEAQARDRLKVVALYKQLEHQPILAQIETALLQKMGELLQSLDTTDTYAANKITSLVNALLSLKASSPVVTTDTPKTAGGDGNVIVNIQNNI